MRDALPFPALSFIALLKREWLEHRTALLFPPAALLALIVLALLAGVVFSERIRVDIEFDEPSPLAPSRHLRSPVDTSPRQHEARGQSRFFMVGPDAVNHGGIRAMPAAAGGETLTADFRAGPGASPPPLDFAVDSEAGTMDADGFSKLQLYLALPFLAVLLLVVSMLAINVTWDERKDRSILFWKSMPVSDTRAILAKFVFIGWITPWATVAAILVAQFVIAGVLDFYSDEALLVHLATDAAFYTGVLQLFAGALLLGFWIAPVVAWLMFIGATVRRSPALWSVLGIVMLAGLEYALFNTGTIGPFVLRHMWPDTLPENPDGGLTLPSTRFLVDLGLGIIVGALLLAATVWSRRRFNEA